MITKLLTQVRSSGQSLVETALFLPILFIMLGGVVEVSNLLVTQNRVSTAARVATGYGAGHFQGEDWDDPTEWSTTVANVARNNVTDTLELDPALWDIYVVKARLNPEGTAFVEWSAQHPVDGAVISDSQWAAMESEIQADVLDSLEESDLGLEILATVAFHDRNSLLGLNAFNVGQLTRVRGLSVMRLDEPAPYDGCPLLPISVRLQQHSAYPSNWDEDEHYLDPPYPGDNPAEQLFPDGSKPNNGFEYPTGSNIPVYLNEPGVTPPRLDTATFEQNVPGVPLNAAQSGYIYWAREQGPSGGFGWLSWNGSTSSSYLRESLTWPGNYLTEYPGSPADTGTTGDPPHADTGDGDGNLEIGEWVENSTGNMSSAEGIIQDYIERGVPVTLLVTDMTNGETGSNANFRIAGFITVKLLGYSFQGNNDSKWIVFEVVGWQEACESDE